MKKITAGFICIALLLLSMPGVAQAQDTPKKAFEGYFLNYLSRSIQMQQSLQEALQKNSITFGVNANLLESNIDLADGTKMSNIPGHASMNLAFNLADKKCVCNFIAQLSSYNVQGQVFMDKDGIIMPRETVKSMAAVGADVAQMGNLDQLPEYVLYPNEMSTQEWDAFNQALNPNATYQANQLANLQALMNEILEIIPDSCYSYSGNFAVLDLTKIALDPDQFLSNLKSHSQHLTDLFWAMASDNPTLKNDLNFQNSMAEAKAQALSYINGLRPSDLLAFMKEIPVTVKTFKIYASPDHFQSSLDIDAAFAGDTLGLTAQSDAFLQPDVISSTGTSNLFIHTSDFNMDMQIAGDSSTSADKATFKATFSGKGQGSGNTISGKIGMNMGLDWSQNTPIDIPEINQQNCKRVEPLFSDKRIRVFMKGKELNLIGPRPMVYNGRTMLPSVDMAEALGCKIIWQAPDTIVASRAGKDDLVMHLNSTSYQVGEQEYTMAAAPLILDGRSYLPIGVIADYCGLSVDWAPGVQIVFLNPR